MRCGYFEAGACRSCVRMGEPYPVQLAAKDAAVRRLLATHPLSGELTWADPCPSPESGFRAKAKMVVAGTPESPTLGILDASGAGVDLRKCGILGPYAAAALPVLAGFVTRRGLRPYDVRRRTGELKQIHLIETMAPRVGEIDAMVRFVLRSEGQVGTIRRGLPELTTALTAAGLRPPRVVTANLLPQHTALAEGDVEIRLSDEAELPMPVGDVTLFLHPGAFLQTNAHVAGELYRQAARWIAAERPRNVLDLYCGVGGFAVHAARALGRDSDAAVTGVEVSTAAIEGARRAALEAGLPVRFEVGDATTYGLRPSGGVGAATPGDAPRGVDPGSAPQPPEPPDLVIVNPPRRGLGPALAETLEDGPTRTVVYSSCNPATLAADLARMPSLRPVRARLFDMFPQTDHTELLVLLRRLQQ